MRYNEVSIIIVNYNTAKFVRHCLKSIYQFLKLNNYEVIVVDNNSPNREIEQLQPEFPGVKFIFRNINDGFGGGCNAAVKESSGVYLLFLNPDVRLIDNSVELLVNFIKTHENAGIISGLLVDSNEKPIYCFNDFPDLEWEYINLTGNGYEKEINKLLNRIEIKKNESFEVDWIHGAFLFMRRKEFDDVSGFNEKYFMYYEDVEICYEFMTRLKKKNICLPNVRVYHHTQSSLEDKNINNIFNFHMHRGKILFAGNYGLFKRWTIYLAGIISVIVRIISVPFMGKYKKLKKEKYKQLLNILKLYLSKSYLGSSKFKYVKV